MVSALRHGSTKFMSVVEGRGTEGEVVISSSPAPQRHLQTPLESNGHVSRTRDSREGTSLEVLPLVGVRQSQNCRMVTLHRGANGGLGIGFAMAYERDSEDQKSAHGNEQVVELKRLS